MAADYFLKIEGIKGESTDDKHKDQIEILNFSTGVSQPVSGASKTGGRTGGRADFQDFTVTKTVDTSTPDLMLHCANGKHIPKIEFESCLATEDKHTFLKYEFTDVIVASVSPSGSAQSGENKPLETVSFAYGKMKIEYTPISSDGKAGAAVDRTWDLTTNKQG